MTKLQSVTFYQAVRVGEQGNSHNGIYPMTREHEGWDIFHSGNHLLIRTKKGEKVMVPLNNCVSMRLFSSHPFPDDVNIPISEPVPMMEAEPAPLRRGPGRPPKRVDDLGTAGT